MRENSAFVTKRIPPHNCARPRRQQPVQGKKTAGNAFILRHCPPNATKVAPPSEQTVGADFKRLYKFLALAARNGKFLAVYRKNVAFNFCDIP